MLDSVVYCRLFLYVVFRFLNTSTPEVPSASSSQRTLHDVSGHHCHMTLNTKLDKVHQKTKSLFHNQFQLNSMTLQTLFVFSLTMTNTSINADKNFQQYNALDILTSFIRRLDFPDEISKRTSLHFEYTQITLSHVPSHGCSDGGLVTSLQALPGCTRFATDLMKCLTHL